MNGTFDEGLASDSSTRAKGSFSFSVMVRSSVASRLKVKSMSVWPMFSILLQRLSEATQSSAVTGLPSCHLNPSRSVNV